MLDEMAAKAVAHTREQLALQGRLLELQVKLLESKWLLNRDNGLLAEGLGTLLAEETSRFADAFKSNQTLETEIVKLEQEVASRLESLEKENPASIRTIVALDMSRYSDVVAAIESQGDTSAVGELNNQIQNWVDSAVGKVGLSKDQLLRKKMGDGALIIFDMPVHASLFAKAYHEISHATNKGKRKRLNRRHFRIGIATGPVLIQEERSADGTLLGYDMAGITISNAVRLEGACRTGEVMIDHAVYELLPNEEQSQYGNIEIVQGKRKEQFRAHRRRVVPPAPWV